MARNEGRPSLGTPDGAGPKRRETREMVRVGVAVVALVLLIAFVLDNSHTVTVGFVVFSTRISLIWALLIAAVLGALVDRLAIILRQRRKKAAKKL